MNKAATVSVLVTLLQPATANNGEIITDFLLLLANWTA